MTKLEVKELRIWIICKNPLLTRSHFILQISKFLNQNDAKLEKIRFHRLLFCIYERHLKPHKIKFNIFKKNLFRNTFFSAQEDWKYYTIFHFHWGFNFFMEFYWNDFFFKYEKNCFCHFIFAKMTFIGH